MAAQLNIVVTAVTNCSDPSPLVPTVMILHCVKGHCVKTSPTNVVGLIVQVGGCCHQSQTASDSTLGIGN
jgi:hypothetical protein